MYVLFLCPALGCRSGVEMTVMTVTTDVRAKRTSPVLAKATANSNNNGAGFV